MRTSVTILALCRLRNIFHKNRKISILTIKKKTTRLTLPQAATKKTKQGETKNKTKTRATAIRT